MIELRSVLLYNYFFFNYFSNVIGQFETQSTPRPPVKPFDPTDHDLDANFRLTKFADLKG
jgi:hypothetical protein